MKYPKKERIFFFEKKKQKTFIHWAELYRRHARKCPKVFWFFFSKKNTFFLREKFPPNPGKPPIASPGAKRPYAKKPKGPKHQCLTYDA